MKNTISALGARFLSKFDGSVDQMRSKDMDIFDHIEKIVELAQKHGLEKCLARGKVHCSYITEKLGISPLQAVLFSLFMEHSSSNNILLSEIAETIHASQMKVIKYMTECEELEKKKLVRCSRGDYTSYRIPREVRESLRKTNCFTPEELGNLSIEKFFIHLSKLFSERGNDELTYEALSEELLDLLNMNMHLGFCKKIMSFNLDDDNLILLLCFCHLAGNNSDDNIGFYDIEFLYEDKGHGLSHRTALTKGNHIFIEKNLVEHNQDDGFRNNESWKLTDHAKKELLFELDLAVNQKFLKNMILHDTIKTKRLYYNGREKKEISTLTNLLIEPNFREIQKRLDDKGMRNGFACLFSGSPGTGKTETVYQIARETGRNIMMVDLSRIKSMWVGESERRTKEVFTTYQKALEKSEIAPILLFNEADGIIGARKEFNPNSRAVDQMENTVQNILLQEMENLKGIMIATTNLTKNMDSAFERRFLYRINFDRPSTESRQGIWTSMMPSLGEEEAAGLSQKYDLSGGQIENIARKAEVDALLQGQALDMETLHQICAEELNSSFYQKPKAMGFGT
ncbi:MAG: ATP-binding protein [Treponema sp.]|nr:ATP-binding protein [Treponema sp.]